MWPNSSTSFPLSGQRPYLDQLLVSIPGTIFSIQRFSSRRRTSQENRTRCGRSSKDQGGLISVAVTTTQLPDVKDEERTVDFIDLFLEAEADVDLMTASLFDVKNPVKVNRFVDVKKRTL